MFEVFQNRKTAMSIDWNWSRVTIAIPMLVMKYLRTNYNSWYSTRGAPIFILNISYVRHIWTVQAWRWYVLIKSKIVCRQNFPRPQIHSFDPQQTPKKFRETARGSIGHRSVIIKHVARRHYYLRPYQPANTTEIDRREKRRQRQTDGSIGFGCDPIRPESLEHKLEPSAQPKLTRLSFSFSSHSSCFIHSKSSEYTTDSNTATAAAAAAAAERMLLDLTDLASIEA